MMSLHPYEILLARLSRVRPLQPANDCSRAVRAYCPVCHGQHKRKDPTLAISELNDGRVLVHCHRQCSVEEITAAVGLTVADLYLQTYSLTKSNGGPSAWAGLMHAVGRAEELGALLVSACAHDVPGSRKVEALLELSAALRNLKGAARALLRSATRGAATPRAAGYRSERGL